MNIFFLDRCARQAAQWQVDRHVVKMLTETAQILSTTHRLLDGLEVEVLLEKDGKSKKKKVWVLPDHRNDIFYNVTHKNHPSCIWARSSVENYNWLVDHLFALGEEYTHRYDKKHATIERLGYHIQSPPLNLKEWDWTEPPCAMGEEFIVSTDPVENYREYYRKGKVHLHSWKRRERPEWI